MIIALRAARELSATGAFLRTEYDPADPFALNLRKAVRAAEEIHAEPADIAKAISVGHNAALIVLKREADLPPGAEEHLSPRRARLSQNGRKPPLRSRSKALRDHAPVLTTGRFGALVPTRY